MTEILTESFCERCGTRYTFESARPRARLKRVRVLSHGLKNFVLSDDTSMDEAMAAARSDSDRESTAHQLDAFHKTFNFCMSCRQYTCPNCWNEAEARCLSCAPHLGSEIMQAPFLDLAVPGDVFAEQVHLNGANGANGSNGLDGAFEQAEAEALRASDDEVDIDFAARLDSLTAGSLTSDRDVAIDGGAPGSPDIAERAASRTSRLLERFRPGESLDAELDAYEQAHADALAAATAGEESLAAVVSEPEIVMVAEVEPEVVAEVEPEVVAEVELVTEPEPEPEPEPEMVAAPDIVAEPEMVAAPEIVAEPEMVAAPEIVAEPEMVAAPEIVAEPEVVAEVELVTEPEPEPEPEPGMVAAPEIVAVPEMVAAPEIVAEPERLAEPEVVVDAEVVAEPVELHPETIAEPEVVTEPAILAVAEPEPVAEPELIAEPEPEPMAAEPELIAEPEPEPMAAEPEPVAQPEPEPMAAEPEPEVAPVAEDIAPQPTWRMVAPDPTPQTPVTSPQQPNVAIPAAIAPDAGAEPQWPTRPEWLASAPDAGLPFLGRPVAPQGGLEALWVESTRVVIAPVTTDRPGGGVQPCISCGLSLSANARFCRRCGTSQPR